MNKSDLHIRRAAVLGAGVMGAQIAAHLVNAGVPTILYELPGDDEHPNRLVDAAIARLARLKPAPLAAGRLATHIAPANYAHDLHRLADCDLVIEAIAERMDWKKDLYAKVVPHLNAAAILATNTSGLSIDSLAEKLPRELHARFCGVHFFNPPRYMRLAELIPGDATDPDVLDRLETFLTTSLGKGVVRAKDTPNFVGNRVGVFASLAAMHHTRAFGLDFDVVDQLTGPRIGRPKSATYRTADVVGLDTMAHVIHTMADTLPGDPWHAHFVVPDWFQELIDTDRLGQKSGAGIYRKRGRTIEVLDLDSGEYRESGKRPSEAVLAILELPDPAARFEGLRNSENPEARFLWACFRDLFHYCAVHLEEIAESARHVDFAMRWGYGYRRGPFETWQAAGWNRVAAWLREDIEAGETMAGVALPGWVDDLEAGPHGQAGSFAPASGALVPRSDLPVYRRQPFPELLLGETADPGHALFEDDSVRIWHQDDGVAVLSFKSKMHTVSPGVIQGMEQAVAVAEADFDGLVIWQEREPFCVGADLAAVGAELERTGPAAVRTVIENFQAANVRLSQAQIPVVAGVRGMALGGGCEILMHCDRTVAAFESYIGLVEAGVGLLPAGGGLAVLANRAASQAGEANLFDHLKPYFEKVAMGKVSSSAVEARDWGFLGPCDLIVMHPDEVLHVARAQVRALAESAYRPPLDEPVRVAGHAGIANFKSLLVNMLEGHFISPHDYAIASRIAAVLCGGEIEPGGPVDRRWLLDLERDHFLALIQTDETRERIQHMLETGKPLRN